MHPLFEKANSLYSIILDAAKEVRQHLVVGLLESIYEDCLEHELKLRNFNVTRQKRVDIQYKGKVFQHELRLDLVVEDCFVIELKSNENGIRYEHRMQCLSYLKALNYPLGVVINFGASNQKTWYQRVILAGAGPEEPTAENLI